MDLEKHLMRNCPYVKFKCLNADCNYIGKRKDAEDHTKECEYRPVRCHQCNGYFVQHKLNVINLDYCNFIGASWNVSLLAPTLSLWMSIEY